MQREHEGKVISCFELCFSHANSKSQSSVHATTTGVPSADVDGGNYTCLPVRLWPSAFLAAVFSPRRSFLASVSLSVKNEVITSAYGAVVRVT